jgi:hypothetical protein
MTYKNEEITKRKEVEKKRAAFIFCVGEIRRENSKKKKTERHYQNTRRRIAKSPPY